MVGYNWGDVSGCSVDGTVIAGDMAGNLIGRNSGMVNTCRATGTLSGTNYLGGLAGDNYGGTVVNSGADATITGYSHVGGLIGSSNSSIQKSKAKATINAQHSSEKIGGLLGWNSQGSVIDCYAEGQITSGLRSSAVGGLVGFNNGDLIESYAATAIAVGENSEYIGGLTGRHYSWVQFSRCYFLSLAGPDNGYGTPLSEAAMKQQSSFAGWDFGGESANGQNEIWRMCVDGVDNPRLSWEFAQSGDFACGDGVDLADLSALADRWLSDYPTAGTTFSFACDANGDDRVDLDDLSILGENWP